jgi:hypothetical protein
LEFSRLSGRLKIAKVWRNWHLDWNKSRIEDAKVDLKCVQTDVGWGDAIKRNA